MRAVVVQTPVNKFSITRAQLYGEPKLAGVQVEHKPNYFAGITLDDHQGTGIGTVAAGGSGTQLLFNDLP